jgi:hypothetical protein
MQVHSYARPACLSCHYCTAKTCMPHLYSFSTERRTFGAQTFDPHTPPPNAGSIDRRHSSSQSLVCKNDAHRTSSPGERYFLSYAPIYRQPHGAHQIGCPEGAQSRMQTHKKPSINKVLNRLICTICIGGLLHYVFNDFATQHIFRLTNSKGPADGSNH